MTVLSAPCFHYYRTFFDAEYRIQQQWHAYENASPGRKKDWKKDIEIYPGTKVSCIGPFTVSFLLNATPIADDVYFTRDDKLGAAFKIAQHCWRGLQMPVNAVSHGEAPLKHSAMLETEGGFTALLDTGAGPSLITKSALTRIDPEYVIQPDSNVYTTANGQTMAIYGRVENVPIEVKGHKLPFPAVVVEKLPDEDIILGRDFITMYDILIDIPRHGILIRNTERKYEFIQLIEEDMKASPYIGKLTRVEYIEGESTKETEYRVRPLRKNDKCNNDLSCWLADVYKDESHSKKMMQAGIGLPNSVVKVSGDKTKIALLNAKPALSTAGKDAIELEPDDLSYWRSIS